MTGANPPKMCFHMLGSSTCMFTCIGTSKMPLKNIGCRRSKQKKGKESSAKIFSFLSWLLGFSASHLFCGKIRRLTIKKEHKTKLVSQLWLWNGTQSMTWKSPVAQEHVWIDPFFNFSMWLQNLWFLNNWHHKIAWHFVVLAIFVRVTKQIIKKSCVP